MARFNVVLPQMGESVTEATITNWLKNVGDSIEVDEAIVEIATDKVDSEVPSEVSGTLVQVNFSEEEVAQVGDVIAVIETGDIEETALDTEVQAAHQQNIPVETAKDDTSAPNESEVVEQVKEIEQNITQTTAQLKPQITANSEGRFYSPLVRKIAREENVSESELNQIKGSGLEGRVTKNDILQYIDSRSSSVSSTPATENTIDLPQPKEQARASAAPAAPVININSSDEIIELNRMAKLTSEHMTKSLATSAHVQSFIEVDVTNLVEWRNRVKDEFYKREGEKLTFTPIFIEAVARALKNFPMLNISFDGERIIKKSAINIGMAAALADGNLIVPVIKNADQLNLVGLAKKVNELAHNARNGKLKPDDVTDGTYTVTNVGSFGSVFGTPIINQPQVGILALGAIRKMPAVISTEEGDFIGIRSKMFLSHSYDHRIVNGALGGSFIKFIAEHLESWDVSAKI
jgi:2-oxoglutarate dehydrogenase E2 component (dihydrolipoamide succinyltransferase)